MQALANQKAKDEKIGNLLTSIRNYLPSLHREGGARTSDYLVHPTALAHLRRRFNAICSSLLRNDSLADMSDRSVLYFELLEWLEVGGRFQGHTEDRILTESRCRLLATTKHWLA